MACIKSAQRSMLVAMAPDAPYLVAGTMAGADDLSLCSTASLEIFKLDFQSNAPDMPLVASVPSSRRFNRLSWSNPFLSDEFSLGLVAGGRCDGSIGLWNPQTMISSQDQDAAFLGRLKKHAGPVRGLEFSTISPHMLASGSDKGKLCIWNLSKPFEPNMILTLKNAGSCAQTEVSFVSWNRKFQHILASTSYNGITLVWDLRQQEPVARISDTKGRCSVLQWSPEFSTELVIASDDDKSPSLKVWDMKNTKSPVKEFVGHTRGVVAMSWCPYDYSYLITCGKDNRTICWDTKSGEIANELPASTNWNVDVHWCPKVPGVISASSSDGKIGIYDIQVGAQPSTKIYAPLDAPTAAGPNFSSLQMAQHEAPNFETLSEMVEHEANLSVPGMAQLEAPMFGRSSVSGMTRHEAPMFGLSSVPGMTLHEAHEALSFGLSSGKYASSMSIEPSPGDSEPYPIMVGAQPSTEIYAPSDAPAQEVMIGTILLSTNFNRFAG